MDIREEIKGKFNEFNTYLENIDMEMLRKQFSRQELESFKEELHKLRLRSLTSEIGQLTLEMKNAEYPQLLGVHHFPILNDIDFLTEKKKIELDKFLAKHRVGNFVYGLGRIVLDTKVRGKLEMWLEEKGVIAKSYAALCDCGKGTLSKHMDEANKDKLINTLASYKASFSDESYDYLEKTLDLGCFECDEYIEFEDMQNLRFKMDYKMIMERDTSLENV